MATTSIKPTRNPKAVSDPSPPSAELELDSVRHAYGEVDVLAGIDLRVGTGECVAIVGPSGCGKSTLLELVAGLAEPTDGRIAVAGETAAERRLARSAYMPQRDLLLPWLTAIDNAALGPRLSGRSRREARERAHAMLERLGLSGFEGARPSELSGGMRQRVAFARTLLSGKPLLLLDEPLAALDAISRADLQEWLVTVLAAEPRTVLLVTHDVEEALFIADRTVVLSGRPARPVLTERSPEGDRAPRAEIVTDPAFVRRRERALLALSQGGSR